MVVPECTHETKNKTLVLKIDKSLEKLRGKNLFPEKLAKANEVIARVEFRKNKLIAAI
jgi:hypothetical protein